MPTTVQQIITEAKRLERLQRQRRQQRKALNSTDGEIRLVRKLLRGLAADTSLDPDQPLPAKWKGMIK
jgi:hypothetical protein